MRILTFCTCCLIASTFCVASCTSIEKKADPIRLNAFESIFDTSSFEGSILIWDYHQGKYYSNDFERSATGFLPASTFKIPNSIIALETGNANLDDFIFRWDGERRAFSSWEKDLTLKEAFRVSCVPCYQELARKAGTDSMRHYLGRLGYPGMVFDSSTVDNFWLEGPSAISAFEQVDFLKRFYFQDLPISEKTWLDMKEVLLLESNDNYKLSAKTGLAMRDLPYIGWLVGYWEEGEKLYFFATNLQTDAAEKLDLLIPARLELTKAALNEIRGMKQ
jgi:beta-lactamase class D OXA-209